MIFSSVAGFLRFTLAFSIFPLLSLSFVSCFLFLFPVVFLCLFNPFSLSISFHFFPLSLFCFSMLLYPLCSLSLSSTLFFLLVFYYRLPGCRVAGLPGRRVAGLPGTTAPLPSSLPLRLGPLCSGSNKNLLSISQTEMGISSSPFKVSSCSQKRECQRRESQRRKKIQVVKKAGKWSEFRDAWWCSFFQP